MRIIITLLLVLSLFSVGEPILLKVIGGVIQKVHNIFHPPPPPPPPPPQPQPQPIFIPVPQPAPQPQCTVDSQCLTGLGCINNKCINKCSIMNCGSQFCVNG